MKVTPKHNERVANMKFFSVYPHYVTKVERKKRKKERKKERKKAELHELITCSQVFMIQN